MFFEDLENIQNPYGKTDDSLIPLADVYEEGLVSVIMPCYNASAYLREAVDSVLNQTYDKVEVIVIDDGSTDDSRNILGSYGEKIITIFQKNKGACVARNEGLKRAKGEFIQFLDSDDLLYENAIEIRLNTMDSKTDIVFGDYDQIDAEGKKIGEVQFANQGRWNQIKTLRFLLEKPARILINNLLHKRASMYQIGGFDALLPRHQEANLHLRLVAKKVRFSYLPIKVAKVRFHDSPDRISNNNQWWHKDPEFLLKITANYYYEINRIDASLIDPFFKEILAKMLRDTSVCLAAFISVGWGKQYLQEANYLSGNLAKPQISTSQIVALIIRSYWLLFRVHGGKTKRKIRNLLN